VSNPPEKEVESKELSEPESESPDPKGQEHKVGEQKSAPETLSSHEQMLS